MMRGSGKIRGSLMLAVIGICAFAPRSADAADKVTFVTDFGYNGRHAYYFVALEKGYYAKQNLEVQIVRGQGSADAVKQVAAGSAQIGFADTAAVILGRGNDQIPTKLVAIVYAKPPHAIYVLKDSGHHEAKGPRRQEDRRYRLQRCSEAVRRLCESRENRREQGHLAGRGLRYAAGHADDRPRRRHRSVHRGRAAAGQVRRAQADPRHCPTPMPGWTSTATASLPATI